MIENLQKATLNDFRGGRQSARNLTNMIPEACLVASDVMFLGDGNVRKRKGYTKVLGTGAQIQRIFDFQRQSDQQQWLLLNYGTSLAMTRNDGSAVLTVLSAAESATSGFAFATSVMGLYASNGINAYAEYNVSGTETLWTHGLPAPVTAPTISLSSGTLSLDFGRQYAFCNVSKWTDNQGTSFVHVGPPSPISGDTGPFTNKIVNVGGLTHSTNPRVTHIWVFGTTDAADGQGGNLIFVGEVTNGTTTFGDQLTVTELDSTRVLPIDNLPPLPYQWVVEYQGRLVTMGMPSSPNSIFCSGLDEIDLGIPQESFPSGVRFTIPGKVKKVSGGIVFNQTLMIATPKMWFQVSGFDQTTFQKNDDIIEPGCAGFQAVTVVQNQMVWLAPDKKLWGWDFSGAPVDLSAKLAQPIAGLRSMNDITDAQLPNAIVRVFNFGKYHLLLVGVSTDGTAGISWLQAYDASSLVGASGYRSMLSDGSNVGLTESDFNFTHKMFAMSPVDVGNTTYIFFGDGNGNVFRFPDGPNCDAGIATITNISLTSNVVTVTAANTYLTGGKVTLTGLTTATFLNNATLTVLSASATQFTATFTHANYVSAADTGTVTGNLYTPQWGSIWLNHKMPGVIKRYMWCDLTTDREDALGKFILTGVSGDGVDMLRPLVSIPTQIKPASYGSDPTVIRGSLLSQSQTANGYFTRVLVTFPSDTAESTLHTVDVSAIPLAVSEP